MKPAKIADFGITEEFGYLPAHAPALALSPGNEEWDQFGSLMHPAQLSVGILVCSNVS